MPFPAAVYMTNHDESLRRARLDGQVRRLKRNTLIAGRDAASILASDFGVEVAAFNASTADRNR